MVEGSRSASGATVQEGQGFWESLKELLLPAHDRYTYAESTPERWLSCNGAHR
jgi:hypothetical protein